MNLHVFCIHLMIIMIFFHYALSEGTEIDSEPEQNEAQEISSEEKDSQTDERDRRSMPGKMRQCAVMYKNEEPVGILQPYKDSYQLLPIHSDEVIPVDISPIQKAQWGGVAKREAEETAAFSDDKYPLIFAKFKIDSRIEKEGNRRGRHVRESKNSPLFSPKSDSSLKSTLSKIETNDEGAEVALKEILNDMGLLEDSPMEKRQAELNEDEDLELGTNKIDLVKIDNEKARPERALRHPKQMKAATKNYGAIEIPEPKSVNEDEYIDQYMKEHPEQLDQSKKERKKRAESVAEQMEAQIKEKLQKIKEEVKNEIEKIKASSSEDLEDAGEGKPSLQEEESDEENKKSQRKKRNAISSLVEQETGDLDPVLSGDNNLAPHIRRRRKRSLDQYVATTDHYLIRNLKKYKEEEEEEDLDSYQDESDDKNRAKKECKCSGKNCRCEGPIPQKPLVGEDGSNFIYFDGAPERLPRPFDGPLKQSERASMNIRPGLPKRNRPYRQDETVALAKTRTKILRGLRDGGYVLDLDPDIYRITDQKSQPLEKRKKRNSVLDLVALHGGGPVLNHLLAIRERSMEPQGRSKRAADGSESQQLMLRDMSDEELFGALPQGFEGELARYKRVKRDK